MHKAIYFLFIGFVLSLTSCRKDFDTVPSTGNLEFSKQTVYLDTIFSDIGSSTYMLKVYNRSNKDISIPSVSLAKADSKYRIMVDGMTGVDADNNGQGDGKLFTNVELLAKDSLFIFIETTVNIAEANPTDFLYTDEILFQSVNGTQKVNLVTLIQDAVFLYPEKYADGTKESLLLGLDEEGNQVRVTGFELNESDPIHGNEFIFTNDKPYVIYGFAGIPSGKTLSIEAGARVHFHANSGIVVQNGGTLNVSGNISPDFSNPLENEVVFEGDRLEPGFSEIPGQWFGIWMQQGSNSNIDHLTLKNATLGFFADQASLTIQNSQVYNNSNFGILGRNANITGKNVVVNLAGEACLASIAGGSYDFRHCTFNNNWGTPGQVSVQMSNFEKDQQGNIVTLADLQQANFYNSIIFGSNNIELYLDKNDTKAFNIDFKNCLVKFRDAGTGIEDDPLYDFLRTPSAAANQNIINENPQFQSANSNKLAIAPDSPAAGKGSSLYIIPQDILGTTRSSPPDLGAYQSAPFPN